MFRKHISAANKENAPAPESPEELAFIPKVVANCAISGRRLCGVWPLPSFINHSCAPNCHRINVGQIMLVFASQNLPAGAEITMKYYERSCRRKTATRLPVDAGTCATARDALSNPRAT